MRNLLLYFVIWILLPACKSTGVERQSPVTFNSNHSGSASIAKHQLAELNISIGKKFERLQHYNQAFELLKLRTFVIKDKHNNTRGTAFALQCEQDIKIVSAAHVFEGHSQDNPYRIKVAEHYHEITDLFYPQKELDLIHFQFQGLSEYTNMAKLAYPPIEVPDCETEGQCVPSYKLFEQVTIEGYPPDDYYAEDKTPRLVASIGSLIGHSGVGVQRRIHVSNPLIDHGTSGGPVRDAKTGKVMGVLISILHLHGGKENLSKILDVRHLKKVCES